MLERLVRQAECLEDLLVIQRSQAGADASDLDVLEPGLAGMAVMSTTFTALAFNMTFLREQGILKRVRGTPLPPAAYFGGVVGNAVVNAIVQVTLIILVAVLFIPIFGFLAWVAVVSVMLLKRSGGSTGQAAA